MKLPCRCETLKEYSEWASKWHPWFAWYPVRVGPGDCRWLETVYRRIDIIGDIFTVQNAARRPAP